jgi:hypothetical protein
MPETSNSIIQSPPHQRNNKLVAITGFILLGVLIAGLLYWNANRDSSTNDKKPYPYTYDKTDNYLLSGPAVGSGIKFVKPVEFTQPTTDRPSSDQAALVHTISRNDTVMTLGSIAVASVATQATPSNDYLKILDEAIMDPKNKNHGTMTTPIKSFVTDRMDPRYEVALGTARRLSNANLKSNAWLIDFVATDKNKDEKVKPTKFTGQTGLLVGKKSYYYFLLGAVDYNWSANSQMWSQVRNSIQIDQ